MVLEAREWGTVHASMKTQVEALAHGKLGASRGEQTAGAL